MLKTIGEAIKRKKNQKNKDWGELWNFESSGVRVIPVPPRRKPTKSILDQKVDEFINWYAKERIEGNYSEVGLYQFPREMRNLIEKITVWYELRYPEYEINRLMHCCGQEPIHIDDIMFKTNPYINELVDENSDAKELEWSEFYNTNTFIKSLPCEEKFYFSRPRYQEIVYLNGTKFLSAHLHLTRNGIVEMAEYVTGYTKGIIKDEELQGKTVKEVVELFKEREVPLSEDNELEKAIKDYNNWNYQKEEMLNCAMYRIIERGGSRIGPRRAFLFAKEFKRNIDIPMKYAVDRSDPGLRMFMNEYLKAGGSKDLECYVDYFSSPKRETELEKVTIQELILMRNYTPEETELHQKIATVLANSNQYKEGEKAKILQKRLERKIEESKKRLG